MTIPPTDRETPPSPGVHRATPGSIGDCGAVSPTSPPAAEFRACLREEIARVSERASLFLLLFQQDLGRRSPDLSRALVDREGESDGTVLPILEFLVSALDDPPIARAVLRDVSTGLRRRGVGRAEHPRLTAAVGTAVAQVLGTSWTPSVAAAWTAFESWVLAVMADPVSETGSTAPAK